MVDDDSDDGDGLGDDSGLSELGTCSSTLTPRLSDYMSRSDSTISRLASQLERTKLFAKASKSSCAGRSTSASSNAGSTSSLRRFLPSRDTQKEEEAQGHEISDSVHPAFAGNGKNTRKVVDLPTFAPQLNAEPKHRAMTG